jgi:hypothetical protein
MKKIGEVRFFGWRSAFKLHIRYFGAPELNFRDVLGYLRDPGSLTHKFVELYNWLYAQKGSASAY